MGMVNEVQEISWHRNGVAGRGFYAVRFTSDIEAVTPAEAATWNLTPGDAQKSANFLACLTDTPGECYVICIDRLATDGVKFGANSWRGDRFEDELRAAIADADSLTSGAARVGPFCIPTE